jgi:hypothetical protein
MRDAQNVVIQRAIVHIIDHVNSKTTLSELELELEAHDALRAYFSQQVQNALRDGQTGSARFTTTGNAAKECFRMLKSRKAFVDGSQKLADLLLQAMGTNQSIKPGSLVVCLYNAENYPQNALALIKLDPGKALEQRIETVDGKQRVSFDVRTHVMPTANEKLQKAALIPPQGSNEKFDLLLLDKQGPEMANFFAQKFLNAEPARDPKRNAISLYEVGQEIFNRAVERAAPPEETDAILQYVETTLPTGEVDLREWVEKLPVSEETREIVAGGIADEFPEERVIALDREYAKTKLLRKKRFRGGYGVVFEVDSDYKDEVVLDEKREEKNGTVFTILTIRVPGLQWVR